MESSGDVIDLATLENLPENLLVDILSKLDPKSLVTVCQQSRRIRSFCQYAWRDLFKRDVTTKKVCNNSNWEKLYRLAVTLDFPVFSLRHGRNRAVVTNVDVIHDAITIGKASLTEEITTVLKDELEYTNKEVGKFFRQHKLDVTDTKLITLVDTSIEGSDDEGYFSDEGEEDDDFYIFIEFLGSMSAGQIMAFDVGSDETIYSISTSTDDNTYDLADINIHKTILGKDNFEKELRRILKDAGINSKEIEEYFKKNKKKIKEFKKGGTGRYGEDLGKYVRLEGVIEEKNKDKEFVLDITRIGELDTDVSTIMKFICSI